jgi:hypothetical protein
MVGLDLINLFTGRMDMAVSFTDTEILLVGCATANVSTHPKWSFYGRRRCAAEINSV